MKRNLMMIGIAVAALLLSTENIQAQTRQARNNRVQQRVERVDDRYIPQEQPRRVRRQTVPVPIPPRHQRIKVVDNDVIRAFDHERFDSDRLKMADMIFSTDGYMTSAQIIRVSESFSFDSNRVKFLKKAYDNCVDAHNFYMVLRTLEFNSSRNNIMEFILDRKEKRERDWEILYKVSAADMNAIIKALKAETFDSAREKLGMIIVCGNMLTSRQIADMAKTFQFDSNRSNFLLYAYRNCSDPQNYVVAANTLQFSSSRNELMRKISKRP